MKVYVLIIYVFTLFPAVCAESISLGSFNGDGQIYKPIYVREGPKEQIFVYDVGDKYIKVFSKIGAFIGRFGGKGEGPGDIKASNVSFSFSLDGNNLLWTDYRGLPWITVQPLDGRKSHVISIRNQTGPFGLLGVRELSDDGYLVAIIKEGMPKRSKANFMYMHEKVLLKIDRNGTILDQFVMRTVPYGISFTNDGGAITLPFQPEYLWDVDENGQIIFTDGLSRKLLKTDPQTKQECSILLDMDEPQPLTTSSHDRWRDKTKKEWIKEDGEWYERFGKVIEKYDSPIFKTVPCCSDLMITAEGNLLIKDYDMEDSETTSWQYLTEDGKRIVRFSIKGDLYGISKNYILYSIDSDDDRSAYAFLRKDSEGKDIKNWLLELQ